MTSCQNYHAIFDKVYKSYEKKKQIVMQVAMTAFNPRAYLPISIKKKGTLKFHRVSSSRDWAVNERSEIAYKQITLSTVKR